MTTENDKFLTTVNSALTVSAEKATQEMQDAATVAHKCIVKLHNMLDAPEIPASIDKDGNIVYSPLTPALVNSIAQANNTAMQSLRKIRQLDKQDDAPATSGIDALLKQAHGKIKLTQVTQSIELDNSLDDII